jgi:hypothetical protein
MVHFIMEWPTNEVGVLLELCTLQCGKIYRRFRGAYCPHHQGDVGGIRTMMETVRTSETSVNIFQTTQCNTTNDSYFKWTP